MATSTRIHRSRRRQWDSSAHAADLDAIAREQAREDERRRTITPRLTALCAELDGQVELLWAAHQEREAAEAYTALESLRMDLGTTEIDAQAEARIRKTFGLTPVPPMVGTSREVVR